jgi:hypothetical protein
MDTVSNALLFWRLVEVSLVELYLWEPVAAHEKVLHLRGRMTKAAIAQDVTYHSQPLHVAGDIAHDFEPMSDSLWSAYQQLEKRVTAEWLRNSPAEQAAFQEAPLEASKSDDHTRLIGAGVGA